MRIEGTCTLPGTAEQVFGALTSPEMLARVLPGCERVIQLGPPAADGATGFEVRLRPFPSAGVCTVTATITASRRPGHLRLRLHGRGPRGPLSGSGLLDLVEQDGYTVGAYVWEIEVSDPERAGAAVEDGQRLVRDVCERLAAVQREREDIPVLAEALAGTGAAPFSLKTPRGKIIALPPAPASSGTESWSERSTLVATGTLIGLSLIALALALVRWFAGRED
jgi:carbon monoxide dehydrogenase subunit G